MDALRWLHLSDIHFKESENYETKRMRDVLIDELKKILNGNSVDMVFITGDLGYQGAGHDQELEEFIEQVIFVTKTPVENLFIVPGNHDLKRTQSRNFIINGVREQKEISEQSTIMDLQRDFSQYNDFCRRIGKEGCENSYVLHKRENVNVVLLNTSLTAGLDDDEGKLLIDKDKFFEVMKGLKDQEDCLNIVLGHHPITWFTMQNQNIIFNNFNDYNVDIYLCGHVHKAGYKYDLSGQRIIPTYQCGGGVVDDYATTTYMIGEIDLVSKRGELVSYKWLQSEECWTQGGTDGRRAVSGKIKIVLERFKECTDVEVEVNEDEFRRFIINFHEKINANLITNSNIDPKDVFDKFTNMKCNKSVEKQYKSFSRYFQVIDEIMGSSLIAQVERESIPNIVVSEYNKCIGNATNGNEIIEKIVQGIFNEYASGFKYSNTTLKTYFKILVYWSIYECDIFNEEL